MGPFPKVSILIPSVNGKSLLRENLPAVITAVKNFPGTWEIIIIDDGSSDDTAGFIKTHFPEVKLMPLPYTSGYARACNSGAGISQGEILIFLNNDVMVEANFIKPLLENFENEAVFAAGAKSLIAKNGYNETVSQGYFKRGVLAFEYPGRKADHDCCANPRPILHVCGVAFACRRDRFLELGGFDTIFQPFYWEDVDLSYRAWKRGWASIYEPRSIVYHQHSSTINKFYSESYIKYISRRNRILFYWKNITDRKLMLKHILWLPWWIGQNILAEGPGWLRALKAALALLGEIKTRRQRERLKIIWPDTKVINMTRGEV